MEFFPHGVLCVLIFVFVIWSIYPKGGMQVSVVQLHKSLKGHHEALLERAALIMAMTSTREEEEEFRRELREEKNIKTVVTEVGGILSQLESSGKLTKAIVNAAIQGGLIKQQNSQVFSVVQAAEDAMKSIICMVPANTSLALKISILTDQKWISVGVFGKSAVHPLAERCCVGLGYAPLAN